MRLAMYQSFAKDINKMVLFKKDLLRLHFKKEYKIILSKYKRISNVTSSNTNPNI